MFLNGLFMVDMACPRWRIYFGRCWADVGPVGPTSGHWQPCFLGYLGHFMTDHYGGIAYCFLWICALCTHISMFCFICSLTIILCAIKTVQPTPLVVSEPLVATQAIPSTRSHDNVWKPQIWPVALSKNYAKIRIISSLWPKFNQFWGQGRPARHIAGHSCHAFP